MVRSDLMQTRYLSDPDKKALIGRLHRAGGQIRGLAKMVESSECVDALLIQIAAAKAALTQVALELMEKHLVSCVETCMEGKREEVIRRVSRALAAVIRNG